MWPSEHMRTHFFTRLYTHQLETLLRSLGWALTRSELERLRQTFDTGDASLGLVSSDDFIEVFAQATSPSEG